MPKGGFLQGCLADHAGEGIDVQYVRQILAQLGTELRDRSRARLRDRAVGGRRHVVRARARGAGPGRGHRARWRRCRFSRAGPWLHGCHPRPGHDRISIAMLAATDDPFISYAPGGSREYPAARYPGMEATRDAWLAALGLSGAARDRPASPTSCRATPTSRRPAARAARSNDSAIAPAAGRTRALVLQGGSAWGTRGRTRSQSWSGLWERFGKTNQDIDFADEAWAFFQRHARR